MDKWEKIVLLHRLLKEGRYGLPFAAVREKLECSAATAYRLLAFLRDGLGAPVVFDRVGSVYRYDPEAGAFELPGFWFTRNEMEALLCLDYAVESLQGGLFPDLVGPVRARLEPLLKAQKITVQDLRERIKIIPLAGRKIEETVFKAVADKLAEHSIELVDSTLFLEKLLPEKGVLTTVAPDASTWEDIHFGFEMAKRIAGLDIGQTLVVKNRAIVAVEAIEGTDAAILRGGKVANGGIVVIKVSKPDQDMRFDVPVVGPRTIKYLNKVKAKCLAIEARKTLVIDQKSCVDLANRKKISIVAL